MICYSVRWHSLKLMTQDQGRETWDPVHRIQDPGPVYSGSSSILEGSVPNVSLIQPTFHSTCNTSKSERKVSATKIPWPTINNILTAILSFCPPNTSTCFDCRRSLREGKDLDFIVKSRRPIGRDDTGIRQCTTDLENVCFHLSEDCVRSVFPNFVPLYIKFIDNYCHWNKATPCCN